MPQNRKMEWNGSVVLMVVDAAFTSIGLNYFTAVVPKVEEFNEKFVKKGKIKNLRELAEADINELIKVWKNNRSWIIAKETASYLSTISEDDKVALRIWARMLAWKSKIKIYTDLKKRAWEKYESAFEQKKIALYFCHITLPVKHTNNRYTD